MGRQNSRGTTEAEEQTKQFMGALAASDVDVRDISGLEPSDIITTWGVEADAPHDEWAFDTLDNLASDHGFEMTDTIGAAHGRATVVFERY
jgi:hypothetical protein